MVVGVSAQGIAAGSPQYYPFDMPFADATGQEKQPYKYNNKELDGRNGLNWYDYSARYLAVDFPVLPTVDPHAENYYSSSPYAYCFNNPLRFIDPDGRDPGDGILGFLSNLGKQAEKFFFGNASNPPSNLQGADKAVNQLQEIEQGGARAQSASNYVEAVNESMQAVHPVGSTMGAVAKGATGQEVTAGDIGYAALELPVIGTVGKAAKVAKTVDKVADAVKVADKLGDASKGVIAVTKEGVALPKGYKIPGNLVENGKRSGSYGVIENGKFVEKLRIDQATPAGMKGPNTSHFHLNGKGKHYTNPNKLPK
jgi:RHS repeat-associated protein